MQVRTRIAPSPTGDDLHVGSLYTALINFVIARKHEGTFIVRIEDTDRTRYVEGAEKRFLTTLAEFGIKHDEGPDRDGNYGPYRQSERLETYRIYAQELIDKKAAYYCICTKDRLDKMRAKQQADKQVPKYDKHCLTRQEEVKKKIDQGESYVIRLDVPHNREVTFTDMIRGDITINTSNLDDQVLMKSDGYPTYHLAVVVDDNFMKISHVIRAEEWITSTPKHVLLYEAFGWPLPLYAHLPLLRNPDKSKMSKRKNPVFATYYLKHGYLPEVMINYLALMGWSHPQQKEIFDLDEFIKVFELKDVLPVGPAFDPVKLEWMNGEYIRMMAPEQLLDAILEFYLKYHKQDLDRSLVEKTIPLVQERIKKLGEYMPMCEFLFAAPTEYQVDLKSHKKLIAKMHDAARGIKDWNAAEIGRVMQELALAENVKNSEFFMVLRVAITGRRISPPLNESMQLLGKKECVARLGI